MGKLNIGRIRERQLEAAKAAKGSNYYKPSKGKNMIRIFMFEHKVTKQDIAEGLFGKNQAGEMVTEFDRCVTRHFNIPGHKGPVVSNERTMKIYRDAQKSGDKQAALDVRPGKSWFINIVDTMAPDKKVVVWGAPASVYSTIAELACDEEYGEDIFGSDGRDLVIYYDPDKKGTYMYKVVPRKEGLSEKLPSKIVDDVVDLYSPEAMGLFGDVEKEGDANDDEQEEAKGEEEAAEEPLRKRSKLVEEETEEEEEAVEHSKNVKKAVDSIFGKDEDEEEVDLEVEPPKKKKK